MKHKYNWLDFYKNKKVLVTGHTGFKGTWLTKWLCMMGATVKGISIDIPTNPSLFEVLALSSEIEDCRLDINNFPLLREQIQQFQPDIVFHLAAQAIVKDSYQDPFGTLRTNVMGTASILETIRLLSVEKLIPNLQSVVVVTSDKCYENRNTSTGYRETDAMGGYDPYSASKGCAELVTQSYQRSFYSQLGIGLATSRAGNVVGGGDWGNARLLPDAARSFSRSEPVIIRCPQAVRPWQHVLEPLSGYLLLGKLLSEDPIQFSEGWNFGPTCTELASVEEVIQLALTYWPKNNYEVESNSSFHETNLLQLDIHKAVASLGWRPTWNLETTIQKTIQWYQTYYTTGKEKACELVTEQINEFEKA